MTWITVQNYSFFILLSLSNEVSLFVSEEDSNWRVSPEYLQLLSPYNTHNDTSCDSLSRIKNELFSTVMHNICNSEDRMNCHCWCWRAIVNEESQLTIFTYNPPSTQMMTVHLISPVTWKRNISLQSFMLYGTRTITWTVIIYVEGG
jgi:hypothetical protein